jgi:hypothetical protein
MVLVTPLVLVPTIAHVVKGWRTRDMSMVPSHLTQGGMKEPKAHGLTRLNCPENVMVGALEVGLFLNVMRAVIMLSSSSCSSRLSHTTNLRWYRTCAAQWRKWLLHSVSLAPPIA